MDLFLKSFFLKNYFPVANKKLKILFLVFTASFLYPAHSSNIGRCTGDVVSWNSCYNSVKFTDSGVWALGEWKNGRLNGLAIMSWGDKGAYVGEVREGKFHGYGAHEDTDSSYVGDFFEGKKHGLGRSFSKDGSYIGEFKNGAFHGKGVLSKSKAIKQGVFENGTLKEEKIINPTPVFDDEVINRSNIRTPEYQLLKFVSGFIKPKMTEEEIAYMGHLIKKTGYANTIIFEFSGDYYRGSQWEAMDAFGEDCGYQKVIPKNLRVANNLEIEPRHFVGGEMQSKEHEVIYFDKNMLFVKFTSLDEYFADKKKCAINRAAYQEKIRKIEVENKQKEILEKLKLYANKPVPDIHIDFNGESIFLTSLDDHPFSVSKIIVNNECSKTDFQNPNFGLDGLGEFAAGYYITTGSGLYFYGKCKFSDPVKVEIFTNRGKIVKKRTGSGISTEWK